MEVTRGNALVWVLACVVRKVYGRVGVMGIAMIGLGDAVYLQGTWVEDGIIEMSAIEVYGETSRKDDHVL